MKMKKRPFCYKSSTTRYVGHAQKDDTKAQ
jgi:hypothetical protein